MSLFSGEVHVQGCNHPLPKVCRPDLLRQWEFDWLVEAAWAEHYWPKAATRKLLRHTAVLVEIEHL